MPCLQLATPDNFTIFESTSESWRMMIGWTQRPGSVPSLFRLTLISATRQREPTINEIPAQRHSRRYCYRHQKFELYYDV